MDSILGFHILDEQGERLLSSLENDDLYPGIYILAISPLPGGGGGIFVPL